jgi:hypothetical protein
MSLVTCSKLDPRVLRNAQRRAAYRDNKESLAVEAKTKAVEKALTKRARETIRALIACAERGDRKAYVVEITNLRAVIDAAFEF